MAEGKNTSKNSIEKQHKAIQKLQAEIARGRDGPISKRSVKDIVEVKLQGYKL